MIEITADFNMEDVESYIKAESDAWFDELCDELRAKGKEFTERARAKINKTGKVFNNITWNLVSSMGYALVQNNKIVESYFPSVKAGTTGESVGAKYAKGEVFETAHTKDDILLVLVAGMDYALFLDVKGYDVISSSSAAFETELKQLWQ